MSAYSMGYNVFQQGKSFQWLYIKSQNNAYTYIFLFDPQKLFFLISLKLNSTLNFSTHPLL